ncbi:MAG: diaminopimelate epimerase [Flavobacteriales bacterium]|nr:diaminopimelate epimerase [Flavobacteriales bacterium]
MLISFWKYHGTGNDFVMVDDREALFKATPQGVAHLCDRHFGIGADGLILLRMDNGVPRMLYYNSDGRQSTMCGNGGRCFVAFCHFLDVMSDSGEFLAVDGPHPFQLKDGIVSLKMQDVDVLEPIGQDVFLNTGSPHYVQFLESVNGLDVCGSGKAVRYNDRFRAEGVNVNFVAQEGDAIRVRTYERGVEDETYSCGTGVTAAALAFDRQSRSRTGSVSVHTLGGDLSVSFKRNNGGYADIWLHGPAAQVFKGEIEI